MNDLAQHLFDTALAMNRAAAAHDRKNVPITAAECYELANKQWMPAAASEALVRAARTIDALEGK